MIEKMLKETPISIEPVGPELAMGVLAVDREIYVAPLPGALDYSVAVYDVAVEQHPPAEAPSPPAPFAIEELSPVLMLWGAKHNFTEDQIQHALLATWQFSQRLGSLNQNQAIGYAKTCATNKRIDEARGETRRRKLFQLSSLDDMETFYEPQSNEGLPGQPDQSEALVTLLSRVTPIYRSSVFLVDVWGLSYEEAANELGVKTNTVRTRIFRGRKQMRDFIESQQEEPGA